MEISGAVIVVTGASSGIGEATARAAARAGATLVLLARREDRIRRLAAELPEAIALPCDVTDDGQVSGAIRSAVNEFGRVDVLVNNAGQGLHLPLDEVDPADFRAILELNLVAPLVAMQAVIPTMRTQGRGSIVNISSGTTLTVLPRAGAYAASKAGLNMLSAVARKELAADGITVSTVYPYITATEFHQSLRAGARRTAPSRPVPRADTAEHVADVILDVIRSGAEEARLVPEGFAGR